MAATTMEAPLAGASGLAERLLEREPAPLSAEEAQAIVREFLARAVDPPRPRYVARACRCRRPLEFERRVCFLCGHRLAREGAQR